MAIYGVLTRDRRTLVWLGSAAGPEAACEEARFRDRNPPGLNHILVVLATTPDGEWTYAVHDASERLRQAPATPPTVREVQECPLAGYYFVDYL
jgi:hypothetical protein